MQRIYVSMGDHEPKMTYWATPCPRHTLQIMKDLLIWVLWVVYITGDWCKEQAYRVLGHLTRDQYQIQVCIIQSRLHMVDLRNTPHTHTKGFSIKPTYLRSNTLFTKKRSITWKLLSLLLCVRFMRPKMKAKNIYSYIQLIFISHFLG